MKDMQKNLIFKSNLNPQSNPMKRTLFFPPLAGFYLRNRAKNGQTFTGVAAK
jgi:hypothetical protein